jgi:2-dehydro-3-deoxyphosphooctonate aldolase (KDO 8-P synthase)
LISVVYPAEMNITDKIFLEKKPFFILGPCVIESDWLLQIVAGKVEEIGRKYQVPVIFKSSFDKANRTAIDSPRGLGIDEGLRALEDVGKNFGLPLTTDIHEPYQAALAAEVVDILQIPAFLCRQTDLLVAAAQTGKIVNIKKAQFLSGFDMKYPLEKAVASGNKHVMLTERGTAFGYNNLIVDFRNIPVMKAFGKPVVMDCTHSVQRPGGAGGKTGGNREFVPAMALAAKAFGADGYFFEIHPDPDNALSDGPNSIPLDQIESIILKLLDRTTDRV